MPTKVTGILPTGRYQIRNEFTEKYLRLNVGDDVATMACAINHPEELQMWNINDSGGGTYTIRNYANGYSANVQRPVQEGTYVIASGSGTARLFVIKETLVPGNYR
ncbi:hypothetical protein BD410DRAFT_793508 [Rickenella mellea]|uniref:Ricin B lectin domain-containing protein n=1 Tax=Rickenella mellea TaxID=50990 RepID=A0A4Y7PSY7_9AGAM|nr:hypothetical protein BD410DRAFT_793508 [Rickenella mellea]